MRSKLFLFFILTLLSGQAMAQNRGFNPFSIFGVGEMLPQELMRDRALGNASVARLDSNVFSLSNPASVAKMRSFRFEAALEGSIWGFRSNTTRYNTHQYRLPYLAMAFAMTEDSSREWGAKFGLTQFSDVRFVNFNSGTQPIDYVENYTGVGGLNKAFLATGFRLAKSDSARLNAKVRERLLDTLRPYRRPGESRLYFGAQADFVFGSRNVSQTIAFPDSTPIHFSVLYSIQNIYGFMFNGGLIYQRYFFNARNAKNERRYRLNTAVHVRIPAQMRVRQETALVTVSQHLPGEDTVYSTPATIASLNLPYSVRFGFEFSSQGDSATWRLLGDLQYEPWSTYSFFGAPSNLNNRMRAGLGYELKFVSGTNVEGMRGFLSRTTYRLGVHSGQTIYPVAASPIYEYGVSLGFGFRIPPTQFDIYRGDNTPSSVDFTIQAGSIGTSETISQKYITFGLGLGLYQGNWFQRRRID